MIFYISNGRDGDGYTEYKQSFSPLTFIPLSKARHYISCNFPFIYFTNDTTISIDRAIELPTNLFRIHRNHFILF